MSKRLWLFSSDLERSAGFPNGIPDDVLTGITGVGLVEATIGTLNMIAIYEPDEVVYIGTCGAYPGSGLEIGEMVSGAVVNIGSGDTVTGKMRMPSLLPSEVMCSAELLREFVDLQEKRVVCTFGVTEDNELAVSLASLGDVENLELFSIVQAVGSISVVGLLGVTNIVGENGGKEWQENYEMVMRRLVEYVRIV